MYVCLTNGDFYERWREHDCVRVGSWLLLGFNTLNILDVSHIRKKSNTNLSKGRAFAREKEREREREKRVLSSNDEFFFFFF